jgi:hypothetical protein
MSEGGELYVAPAAAVAQASGEIADYCDSAEHNEAVARERVPHAGATLRSHAVGLASALDLDIFELYACRLGEIEQRGIAGALPDAFDGAAAARSARSWLQLQLVQLRHDRHYHPDVAGLSNLDQLRHYAFHLAKLAAAYSAAQTDAGAREDLVHRRLADTLLFGIKLATVVGQRLSAEPLVLPESG